MSAQPQTHAPNLGMQVTTFENPMGIDGFEFVEFAAPAGQAHRCTPISAHGLQRRCRATRPARSPSTARATAPS